MKAPKPTYTRILPPPGNHVARVVSIVYLGTQHSEQFGDTYRVRTTWELPLEKAVFKEGEGEKPFLVSKETSLSMGKKSTLRPFVEGMLGCALQDEEAYNFDLDEILGKECMLYISIDEAESGKYVKVNSATPVPKGMTCPPAVNPVEVLSFDKWNQSLFEKLPDFLKEKVSKSKEYKAMKGIAPMEASIHPDDIPF